MNALRSANHQNDAIRRRSWLWFVGTAGALTAGLSATVQPEAATWFGLRGPQCPIGACLGPLACPGCGLLRSTAATLQGDLQRAFEFHPGGPVVAALLVTSLVMHFDILRRDHETATHRRLRRSGYLLFTVAVLLGWLLRFFLHPN